MSRIIEVVVSPKGETTIQTKGYVGRRLRPGQQVPSNRPLAHQPAQHTAEFYQSTRMSARTQAVSSP